MKNIFRISIYPIIALACLSCAKALDPLENGYYTDENLDKYPSILKGFVDEAYVLSNSTNYKTNEFVYLDCATDDAVATSTTQVMRKFGNGSLSPSDDPFASFWSRDYKGIYYCNRFLQDNKGLNTQYMRDAQQDKLLRQNYQGDAYALRAWFEFDLLIKFGGRGSDGVLYGFPIVTKVIDQANADASSIKRDSYDDCVKQIIADCDSAIKYLPLGNRDWLAENSAVQGSCRWTRHDQMSVTSLKAMTYLFWASDAYNPGNDIKRWQLAAEWAGKAMKLKLQQDGTHGFMPKASFAWTDPNTPEALWISRPSGKTATMELSQYPNGFNGTCLYAPSQELVDAFPAANGFPIDDSRSGYDAKNPYKNRDPRFYADIFYNGSSATRIINNVEEVMYTFNTTQDGKDADGGVGNGLTNYYLKKFIYMGWNKSDLNVQMMPRAVIFIGWRDICLAYAEAANRAVGPTATTYGYSAKAALAYIRARKTSDGKEGVGYSSDAYLDECALNQNKFDKLVRNERRIEFCFEGKRFYDLARWDVDLETRNKSVHKVVIVVNGSKTSYLSAVADNRNLSSKYLPIPYNEIINSPSLIQNEGWSTWSK